MDYRDHPASQQDTRHLYEMVKGLPKIELHRHLEGSLRLGTLADIAQTYQFDLPGYEVDAFRHMVQIVPSDSASVEAFLSKFDTLRQFYQSREIIERVAYEVVADAAADNIAYLELRFTPIALAREKGFPLHEVATWVIDAVEQAKADFDIDVKLIVSMNRHESVEIGAEHIDVAIANINRGVVGVDLAGAENLFPGAPFKPLFDRAHAAGLNVTIHAGEWAGTDSILEAINVLGATRLGHGVRVLEDESVTELARERGITFEVCPTSNIQSGVVASYEQHPLKRMYEAGLLTTVNTDDPGISAINLTDEYVACVERMDFTLTELKQQMLFAAQASFLSGPEKTALADRLSTAFSLAEKQNPQNPTASTG